MSAWLQTIHALRNDELCTAPGVLMLHGSSYPLLFCRLFIQHLAQKTTLPVRSLDLETNLHEQQLILTMSFLGETALYWGKTVGDFEPTARSMWLSFCASYTGPHTLIFFCPTESSATVLSTTEAVRRVALPETITLGEYTELTQIFGSEAASRVFARKVFTQHTHISLDSACLMLNYERTVGRSIDEFCSSWLPLIIREKQSLFTLSQYFFTKQAPLFFRLWETLFEEYPPEFWLAYWTEQLWQAFCFTWHAQAGNSIEGKKLAPRLPFAFIQSGWQRVSPQELAHAYRFLCRADYRIKNGGNPGVLELLFHKFFAHHFAAKSQA